MHLAVAQRRNAMTSRDVMPVIFESSLKLAYRADVVVAVILARDNDLVASLDIGKRLSNRLP